MNQQQQQRCQLDRLSSDQLKIALDYFADGDSASAICSLGRNVPSIGRRETLYSLLQSESVRREALAQRALEELDLKGLLGSSVHLRSGALPRRPLEMAVPAGFLEILRQDFPTILKEMREKSPNTLRILENYVHVEDNDAALKAATLGIVRLKSDRVLHREILFAANPLVPSQTIAIQMQLCRVGVPSPWGESENMNAGGFFLFVNDVATGDAMLSLGHPLTYRWEELAALKMEAQRRSADYRDLTGDYQFLPWNIQAKIDRFVGEGNSEGYRGGWKRVQEWCERTKIPFTKETAGGTVSIFPLGLPFGSLHLDNGLRAIVEQIDLQADLRRFVESGDLKRFLKDAESFGGCNMGPMGFVQFDRSVLATSGGLRGRGR